VTYAAHLAHGDAYHVPARDVPDRRQVGRELDVRPDQLRAWARQQRAGRAFGAAVTGETMEQENRRLRREVATLQQERAFAKKVAAYFAKESR